MLGLNKKSSGMCGMAHAKTRQKSALKGKMNLQLGGRGSGDAVYDIFW